MRSYTHFTLFERKYLQKLLSEGKSFREIAAILERSPSSVSREVNRNCSKYKPKHKPDNAFWYNHWRAQNLYIRRRRKKQPTALKPESAARDFIIEHLHKHWSPEMICGRWNRFFACITKQKLCVSTIYRYVQQKKLPGITAKTHFRRRGKRYCNRQANYNSIQPERIIPQWDDVIKQRLRIGGWEGDTVYGAVGKGLLVTLVDRQPRFLCAAIYPEQTGGRNTQSHCEVRAWSTGTQYLIGQRFGVLRIPTVGGRATYSSVLCRASQALATRHEREYQRYSAFLLPERLQFSRTQRRRFAKGG